MSIVVLGACGQLGSEFCRQLGADAIGLTARDLDITRPDDVHRVLLDVRPHVVINAAAYTDVDAAEEAPQQCRLVNAVAVRHLAEICRDIGAVLVQIGTDYVFGADRTRRTPYREIDPPGPLSIYGRTKLDAERAAADCERHFIVRTCGLYGRGPDGPANNFVETILRRAREEHKLRVVDDQHCTPTYTRDVVRAVRRLLQTSAYGLYHVVNHGSTTWCGFAREVMRLTGQHVAVEPIRTHQYPRRAQRPAYSVLDTSKYEAATGDKLPEWQSALADFLQPPASK